MTFRRVTMGLAGALALGACAAQTSGGTGAGAGGPSPQVAVAVLPGAVQLGPAGTAQFDASVTGTADLRVTWQVREGSPAGGTVSSAGFYTAPQATGTYHVVATSAADPGRSGAAAVTVAGGGGSGTFPPLSYQSGVSVSAGSAGPAICDAVGWTDKDGKARRVFLANAAAQPSYGTPNGGYIHRYEWRNGSTLRQCDNAGGEVGGFGFLVNHSTWSHRAWINSKQDGYGSQVRLIAIGDHHAVWEYRTRLGTSGLNTTPAIETTVHYLFRNGEDQFQYAVAFDASAIPDWAAVAGLLGADSRSPYGSLLWDGDPNPDRRSGFRLGGAQLVSADLQAMTWQNATASTGGYTQSPFVEAWNTRFLGGVQYDDEVGYVQTRLQGRHRGGHGRGAANASASGTISGVDLFDYQMMEYQNWYGERADWQAAGPTGLGQLGVTAGYEDYSLSVLIGPRSARGVQRILDEADAAHAAGTGLVATRGRVATCGIEGPGLPVLRRWDTAGFDQVYRNWVLVADDNAAAATLTVAGGRSLRNPTVVLLDYTAAVPPTVTRAGVTLVAGTDYLASVNGAMQQAWITFLSTFSGATALTFAGPADASGVTISSFGASPAAAPSDAATIVTFTAEIAGAQSAVLDLSALGGGKADPMAGSGTTFTRTHTVPAGTGGGGPLLATLTAQGATGFRRARTAVTLRRPDVVIYSGTTDHVVAGWEPNGHVSKVSTDSPFEGTTHLKVDYGGTGVVADVAFDRSFNLTRHSFLAFAVRGPSGAAQRLGVELRGSGNFGSGVRTYDRTTGYTRLVVPLADFPIDLTQIVGLRLSISGGTGAGTVYLDDISFTAVPPDAPSPQDAFLAGYPGL